MADSITWTYAVSVIGYGVHWYDFDWTKLGDMVKALQLQSCFILIAIIWSKTSFGVTLLRLTEKRMRWIVWFCIITTNIFMGLSILFNFVHCTPVQSTWDTTVEGECWGGNTLLNYHIFAAVYSSIMDVVLALLPWKLVWSLQMKRREKAGVAIAMSMGIFAGATSLIKVTKLPAMNSTDICKIFFLL